MTFVLYLILLLIWYYCVFVQITFNRSVQFSLNHNFSWVTWILCAVYNQILTWDSNVGLGPIYIHKGWIQNVGFTPPGGMIIYVSQCFRASDWLLLSQQSRFIAWGYKFTYLIFLKCLFLTDILSISQHENWFFLMPSHTTFCRYNNRPKVT